MSLEPGEVLAGRFKLSHLMSEGGMGSIWYGFDQKFDKHVAVKVLKFDGPMPTPQARERFRREAQVTAGLTSPNIVTIYDFDAEPETQTPFIAMELLQGRNLAEVMKTQGRLPFMTAKQILKEVCAGLAVAHEAEVVHRDLKPSNIFISNMDSDYPRAKLLDFGVVRAGFDITLPGTPVGTLRYMSPEQAEGASVDERTDIWALALICFEMLTGVDPWGGALGSDLRGLVRRGRLPRPSEVCQDVPSGFDRWFARATEHRPSRRFASAEEFFRGLDALTTGKIVRTKSDPPERQSAGHWSTDASQLNVVDLDQVVFRNRVVSKFLEHDRVYFVSGAKGCGKTLLLRYKRALLFRRYQRVSERKRRNDASATIFIPEGRPYLDFMNDLGSVPDRVEEFMADSAQTKRLWSAGLRISMLLHSDASTRAAWIENAPAPLVPFLERVRSAAPTVVVKDLLGLGWSRLERLLDECDTYLESALRAVHQPIFVFVDKIDQAMRRLSRAAWVAMQTGLVEAAWDVNSTNAHIKVFASIREEAFASYSSPIKVNLTGATARLEYSRKDLEEILERLSIYYEGLPLRDFVTLDFVGVSGSPLRESAFMHIFRHSLGRPRDLVLTAAGLSRHRDSLGERVFKDAVRAESSVLVSTVFDEMAAFLSYLADPELRRACLRMIKFPVLTREEVFGLEGDSSEGISGESSGSVSFESWLGELYDCGLLGILRYDEETGAATQSFRRPHEGLESGELPESEYYFVHPALGSYLAQSRAARVPTSVPGIVIGHQELWDTTHEYIVRVQRVALETRRREVVSLTRQLVEALLEHADGPTRKRVHAFLEGGQGSALRQLIAESEFEQLRDAVLSLP